MKYLAIAAAASLLVVQGSAASACSQRGQFCSYPSWAANAFEAPLDRKPGYNFLPTDKPFGDYRPPVRKHYVKKHARPAHR